MSKRNLLMRLMQFPSTLAASYELGKEEEDEDEAFKAKVVDAYEREDNRYYTGSLTLPIPGMSQAFASRPNGTARGKTPELVVFRVILSDL
ncbi:hypothetical protein MLD38_023058 [Melastoma candidum]|uniref:Uncharacterized protein n=1 Tax=Melastoma candidum TaxID=119954 RepID=A0ACB9QKG8_9MYRT|nr:hypothetical protein MLD38_023058 [Melastoma candidum]